MCQYNNLNKCLITDDICPYVYWCERRQIWRDSTAMPEDCAVKVRHETPKGYYAVADCRKGLLYVDIDNQVVKIPNPYDHRPKFVKLSKTKNGWKVKDCYG